jgi:subtilisin family serine protease
VLLPVCLGLGLTVFSFADTAKIDINNPPKEGAEIQSATTKGPLATAQVHMGKKKYVVGQFEFLDPAVAKGFTVPGASVVYQKGHFVQAFFPLNADGSDFDPTTLAALQKLTGIRENEWGKVIEPPPPPVPFAGLKIKGKGSEKIVRGGLGTLTGEGVVIAIIDTGVDFRHPDFVEMVNGKKTSRFLAYWDMSRTHDPKGKGKAADIKYPDGQSIGTIFSQEDLTEDLRAGNDPLGVTDDGGHGTACAGVAAGNGSLDKDNVGVAPKAMLIGVRLGQNGGLENTYLFPAIADWLDKTAKKQKNSPPLVISCSWGGQYAGRDSATLMERALSDRFPETEPGRLICISAGNDGASKIHARVQLEDEKKPALLTWNAKVPTTITICVDRVTAKELDAKPLGDTKVERASSRYNRISKTTILSLDIPAGVGGINLWAKTKPAAPLTADAYFPTYRGRDKATFFTCEGVSNAVQVGSPGTAVSPITCGSYDFNDTFIDDKGDAIVLGNYDPTGTDAKVIPLKIGGISQYSNAGYLRQSAYLERKGEVIKPDLVAPGQCYTAPASKGAKDQWLAKNKLYQFHNGTSASTPYTAGVIALMLQKKPTLTAAEFRDLLGGSLTQDDFTGRLPNIVWGRGKLDYAAVERLIGKLK